jgi:hypothetical protein
MNQIIENYSKSIQTPSDINEHLITLYELSKECDHITEMGVRNVVSTWAFMLRDPKTLIGIDIHRNENVDKALVIYPKWKFIQADTTKIEIEETDLLFIDTLHTYSQLKKELQLHASKVKKFLVFHDVVTYGFTDEPTDWQTPEIMANYKTGDIKGLMPAISEFLDSTNEWYIYKEFRNNNGLLILARK